MGHLKTSGVVVSASGNRTARAVDSAAEKNSTGVRKARYSGDSCSSCCSGGEPGPAGPVGAQGEPGRYSLFGFIRVNSIIVYSFLDQAPQESM